MRNLLNILVCTSSVVHIFTHHLYFGLPRLLTNTLHNSYHMLDIEFCTHVTCQYIITWVFSWMFSPVLDYLFNPSPPLPTCTCLYSSMLFIIWQVFGFTTRWNHLHCLLLCAARDSSNRRHCCWCVLLCDCCGGVSGQARHCYGEAINLYLPTMYWPHTDHIPTTFTHHIPTTYQPHLLTTITNSSTSSLLPCKPVPQSRGSLVASPEASGPINPKQKSLHPH